MKQIAQNLKSGEMGVIDVAAPVVSEGSVLVQNMYSLVSAGTEGNKVRTARKNLLSKARERPEQVKQVMELARQEGLRETYQRVLNKLDAYSPLGYSCAGRVIGCGRQVEGFKPGDYVACGGTGAAHAEIVSVPRNLVARVPEGIPMEHAAYTTVGAVALQGIRQSGLDTGCNCVVIGLGLVGLLTIQILRASNVKVLGLDINPETFELAQKSGAQFVSHPNANELKEYSLALSDGLGVDAVIITAASSSNVPVEVAGQLCRKKGSVVVVGAVPTGFSRPNYYNKELELKMSCSYGPGRYDSTYEEHGLDYPIGYCRWTENRNMRAFVEMIPRLDLDILTSHVFELKDACRAYDLIAKRSEPYCGIIIRYPVDIQPEKNIKIREISGNGVKPKVAFIGAGSFAQKLLLPVAAKHSELVSVATASGLSGRNAVDKFGFAESTGSEKCIFEDPRINTIFIATRHDRHAGEVVAGLSAEKSVFVEKPLCLTESELVKIIQTYEAHESRLMVGFNRRFAPSIQKLKQDLPINVPFSLQYRINAGFVPEDSWIQDRSTGGGRIIGELCHFIDLSLYLAGSRIVRANGVPMKTASGMNDTLTVSVIFENGSIASIVYVANGGKSLSKECIEVHCAGVSWVLDNFRRLTRYADRKKILFRGKPDKGHKSEVECFLKAVEEGTPSPVPFEEIVQVTKVTLALNAGKSYTVVD